MRLQFLSATMQLLRPRLQSFCPNWRRFPIWTVIALLLTGCYIAHAKEAPVVDASQMGPDALSLTEYLAVLEDPGKALTLADVQNAEVARQFKADQSPAAALNYGYSQSAYWLRLTLRNPGNSALGR
jgi:hypothetical protein